ncbi:MAG: type II toxin-antitoxin system RelE/ParE family toxin [Candidatus Omnitrophica bacterium]|nr:type II toxin-antitoxin system RelE/ParE family toxin [Candidatus Omnitrophota bacterium]
MKKCKCVYFKTDAGRIPVEDFINSLDDRTQQKYFEVVGLLEDYGKRLPAPHSKHLEDEIYELRFTGIEGRVRVLYFFYHAGKAVFTNGLVKKKGPVPRNEIKTAKERMKVYLKRQTKKRVL